MKYAYLKPNNAARELRRVTPLPSELPEGGPDAYVAHFLSLVGNRKALIISTHFIPDGDEEYSYQNVTAKSYYWHSKLLKPFGKISKIPIGTFARRVNVSIVILRTLIKFRPNYILCWSSSFPLWAAFAASRICQATFVYSRHNRLVQENEPWFRRITSTIDNWIIKQASTVIVHGPYLKQQVLDIGTNPNRVLEFNWNFNHLLGNSLIDTQSNLNINNNGEHSVILFIGRLQASKGVFELLEACREMLRNEPAIKLAYAGAGSDFEKLKSQVNNLRLQHKISLLGMVPHSMLTNIIRQSTVVVTPTRRIFPEGRCMATMEGLVMGVPVIAPDFGPFPFLVKHGKNGLLYEPDSVEDLKSKIESVLGDRLLHTQLCEGARVTSRELRGSKDNFSKVLKISFEEVKL